MSLLTDIGIAVAIVMLVGVVVVIAYMAKNKTGLFNEKDGLK